MNVYEAVRFFHIITGIELSILPAPGNEAGVFLLRPFDKGVECGRRMAGGLCPIQEKN